MTPRIGAVSYLNTRPLVQGLRERHPDWHLEFDVPSRLADRLAAAELDVALIPSIELFRAPGYSIVSDACIACRGPVWSVKLLSRVPLEQIRTLALDEGSRTSVALVQILLHQRFGIHPQLQPLPLSADLDRIATDAMLVIGDRAIHTAQDGIVASWDLGDEWCRWAELPFVFAMWTARPDANLQGVEAALAAARDRGVADLESIAAREAPQFGLSVAECLHYLRDNLYFYLGSRERKGLELFYQLAVQRDFVEPNRELNLGLTVS